MFRDARQDELRKRPHRAHQTPETGHGRRDERYSGWPRIPRDFPLKKAWPGARAIGVAVRLTENRDGTVSGDTRYFLSSRYLSGPRFAQAVRRHWGIENGLHRVLDVAFDEDQTRTRNHHMADNLSWLRPLALTLLKRHPSDHSLKGKSQIAGWNNEFLLEVLIGQGA